MGAVKKQFVNLISSPEKIFLIFALFFGSLSAFIVPQLSVADEQMHFLRAYNISNFQVKSADCSYPTAILTKLVDAKNGNFTKDFSKNITSAPITDSELQLTRDSLGKEPCGSATSYNPVVHIPQAIGIGIAELLHPSVDFMILMGRLANVAFYSLFLFFVIKYARVGKWAIVVIALIPSMIHLAGSLSSDTFNNAVVLGFIATIISLAFQKTRITRKQIVLIIALTILLAVTKLPNALLLGLLLLIPAAGLFGNNISASRKVLGKLLFIGSIALIFIGTVFLWNIFHEGVAVVAAPDNPLNERPWHFLRILFNTYLNPFIGYNDVVIEGVTDYFSSFRYSLPDFVVFLVWTNLLFTLLVKSPLEQKISKNSSLVAASLSGALLCGLVLGITYALYTAWAIQPFRLGPGAIYADGVQGRYFTAFLALLIPISIFIKRFVFIKTSSQLVAPVIIVISLLFTLSFYIIQSYYFSASL